MGYYFSCASSPIGLLFAHGQAAHHRHRDRHFLAAYLAANPEAGTSLGSGVRKLRWGPRTAFRGIHFYAGELSPVILLDIFAKSEKANYSPKELAAIRAAAKEL